MTFVHRIRRATVYALLAFFLAAVLLVPARAASVGDFTDVSRGDWYYDAVDYVTAEGLFLGTGDTTFSPGGGMTRGMFVTVLGRFAGVDAEDWCAGVVTGSSVNMRTGPGTGYTVITSLKKNASVTILGWRDGWYQIRYGSQTGFISGDYLSPAYHTFSDVAFSDYYAGYVIWGYEIGIVNGRDADTFAPNDSITREEICSLFSRYVGYAGIELKESGSTASFTDEGDISAWAKADVTLMQAAGIVLGEPDEGGYRFRPWDHATRAEVAVMFQRLSEEDTSPDVTPEPTAAPAPAETPVPTATPAPGEIEDTPAVILDSAVSVPSDTIRVGIYMSTKSLSSSVKSVNLYNVHGYTFEYGVFDSERDFLSYGTIDDDEIDITTDGTTFTVKNSAGETVYTTGGNLAIHAVSSGKALTEVNSWRRYYGDFELRQAYNRSGYITLINYVNIEDYVKGVIPYEYSPSWPAETLKAAAVTARSYAVTAQWSTYRSYGFDITNTSQVYRGRYDGSYSESYFAATDSAVDATAGLYLTYNSGSGREICTTYYFSSSGGATEDSAHIWGGDISYLQGKIDPYEAKAASLASNYTYSITLSRTGSTLAALSKELGLSTIAKDGIQLDTYDDTGNVRRVHITDVNGKTVTIHRDTSYTRWDFLSAFGFTCYSYRYQVTYNAENDTFTCTRWGWGHNVGLSQWGAYAMAKYYDKDYQDILGFYYDGTSLQYGDY